jgi:mono/diheme cytochrome c family protein
MIRRLRIIVGTIVAMFALFVLGAAAFVFSGAYDVSASEPHSALVEWLLDATKDRSIRARGAEVAAMPALDSATVAHGFEHFHAMCVDCHGAPGVDPGETGRGLTPEPPELSTEAAELSDGELFWVTKNGIRFTGMPAFGATHSDDELWAIVAFVRQLEDLGAEGYARLVASAEAATDSSAAEHSHPPGTAPHSH